MIENLTQAAEAVAAPDTEEDVSVSTSQIQSKEPLPDLKEALEKVPQSSRELIDELFRGHFSGMRAIDPKKLF